MSSATARRKDGNEIDDEERTGEKKKAEPSHGHMQVRLRGEYTRQ